MFDRKPLGQQTEDDLTGGTYETQVFNMYAKLRGFHLTSGNTALAIHGMRSEDAEKGSTLSDEQLPARCSMTLNIWQVMG